MILGDVLIPGKRLRCDSCGFEWISISARLPANCQNRECRTREWNGKKPKRHSIKQSNIVFPKPKRIKMEEEDNDEDF